MGSGRNRYKNKAGIYYRRIGMEKSSSREEKRITHDIFMHSKGGHGERRNLLLALESQHLFAKP